MMMVLSIIILCKLCDVSYVNDGRSVVRCGADGCAMMVMFIIILCKLCSVSYVHSGCGVVRCGVAWCGMMM